MLEAECQAAGVQLFLKSIVREVARTTEFIVRTDVASSTRLRLWSRRVDSPIPKIGATAFGYTWASIRNKNSQTEAGRLCARLGERDRNQYCDLDGVSTEVIVAPIIQVSFRRRC